jgi:hypothetical protein
LVLENFQRLAPAALWQKTMTTFADDMVDDGVAVVDESSIPLAWKENVRRQRSSARTNESTSRGGGGRSQWRPEGGGNFQSNNRSNNNNNNYGKRR